MKRSICSFKVTYGCCKMRAPMRRYWYALFKCVMMKGYCNICKSLYVKDQNKKALKGNDMKNAKAYWTRSPFVRHQKLLQNLEKQKSSLGVRNGVFEPSRKNYSTKWKQSKKFSKSLSSLFIFTLYLARALLWDGSLYSSSNQSFILRSISFILLLFSKTNY